MAWHLHLYYEVRRWPKDLDRTAMVRGIYQGGNDNAPRLVFADWLDDHGEDGSQIRVVDNQTALRLEIPWVLYPKIPKWKEEIQGDMFLIGRENGAEFIPTWDRPARLTLRQLLVLPYFKDKDFTLFQDAAEEMEGIGLSDEVRVVFWFDGGSFGLLDY